MGDLECEQSPNLQLGQLSAAGWHPRCCMQFERLRGEIWVNWAANLFLTSLTPSWLLNLAEGPREAQMAARSTPRAAMGLVFVARPIRWQRAAVCRPQTVDMGTLSWNLRAAARSTILPYLLISLARSQLYDMWPQPSWHELTLGPVLKSQGNWFCTRHKIIDQTVGEAIARVYCCAVSLISTDFKTAVHKQ